uniref:Uncharacterized protein n=1 Tax=Ixodes ricinus TaxID=34613 RepID=A0A6B0UZ55_IXORI
MLWFGTVVIRVALAFGFSCSIIGGGIGSMALVEGTLLLASVLDAGEVFVGGAWSALEAVVGLGAAATALSLGGVLILASGHANAPPTGPLRNVGATHCGATHLRSEVQLIWTVVRSLTFHPLHHPIIVQHFSSQEASHHHHRLAGHIGTYVYGRKHLLCDLYLNVQINIYLSIYLHS